MCNKSTIKFLSFIVLALFLAQSVSALTIISQPEDATVSASVGSVSPLDDNCGGCGGGRLTGIIFSGWAYPLATVHIWKDGIPKISTVANIQGYFSITLTELYSPNVLYTLYAIDKAARRSILLNYPVVAKIGYLTQISGIRFPPTIAVDKTEVKIGSDITVIGYALPSVPLDVVIEGFMGKTFNVTSKSNGTYELTMSLLPLRKGDYRLHSNYQNDNKISKVIQFEIGEVNILSTELTTNIPGDCNADQVINIVDFSVAAFWYGKSNPPRCVDTNSDNIINLVDFSILAFYWTG